MATVKNSPFDFTKPHAVGSRIKEAGGGYDHNFVVSTSSSALHRVARVVEPLSGRTLEVRSTKPGVQLYTGNHLSNERGKAGSVYNKYSGFCLETQYFPDTINQPQFPSSILRPGELYHHTTVFTFGVAK
jgi:aldose 1-epimerase